MSNKIEVAGTITTKPEYSHTSKEVKFYRFILECTRLSGKKDKITCIAPDELAKGLKENEQILVSGLLQTRNYGQGHVEVYVLCKDISHYGEEMGIDINNVCLLGYICKKGKLRDTPNGLQIVDIVAAVKDADNPNRTHYVPCVFWNGAARAIDDFEVSTGITIKGRLQSREYTKVYEDGTTEQRTAAEVSTFTFDISN